MQEEFRMTWILRVTLAITVLPLSLLLASFLVTESHPVALGFGGLGLAGIAWVVAVFLEHGTARVLLTEQWIERSSISSTTRILFNEMTCFRYQIIDMRKRLGSGAGVLVGGALGGLVAYGMRGRDEGETARITLWISDRSNAIKLTSNVKGIARLRDALVEVELSRVLPDLERRLDAGEELDFGAIRLGPTVMRVGRKTLERSQLEGLEVSDKSLVLRKKGKAFAFARVRSEKVANLPSLMKLVAAGQPQAS